MEFNSQKVKETIREFLADEKLNFENGYTYRSGFELGTVIEIVNENCDFEEDESKLAYAKGFVIFADVLKEYAEYQIKIHEEVNNE